MNSMLKLNWVKDARMRTLLCAAVVGMSAPFYFTPLDGEFRLSLGVLVMGTLVLAWNKEHAFEVCALSGCFTIGVRIFLDLMFGHSLLSSLQDHTATLAFYLVYGGMCSVLLGKNDSTVKLFLKLAFADMIGNITESLFRVELSPNILIAIGTAGIFRALLSVAFSEVFAAHRLYVLQSERQLRYDRICLLLSQVRVENFYLQKTTTEIDRIMRLSFALYDANRDKPEVREQALEISRSIHEVGKDTRRVRQGLEAMISGVEQQRMTLSEIIRILSENTQHMLEPFQGKLTVTFDATTDFYVGQCYGLLAVLNNLITNALDACNGSGHVEITARSENELATFTVRDNGSGIDPELLPYIFNPGFTTKFDSETGHASTGIGLNHVQNLVQHLGGTINIESECGAYTLFTITIPISSLSQQTYKI